MNMDRVKEIISKWRNVVVAEGYSHVNVAVSIEDDIHVRINGYPPKPSGGNYTDCIYGGFNVKEGAESIEDRIDAAFATLVKNKFPSRNDSMRAQALKQISDAMEILKCAEGPDVDQMLLDLRATMERVSKNAVTFVLGKKSTDEDGEDVPF